MKWLVCSLTVPGSNTSSFILSFQEPHLPSSNILLPIGGVPKISDQSGQLSKVCNEIGLLVSPLKGKLTIIRNKNFRALQLTNFRTCRGLCSSAMDGWTFRFMYILEIIGPFRPLISSTCGGLCSPYSPWEWVSKIAETITG